MSTIDQQFVEYIVKSLVGNPDEVVIERRIDEKGVLLELTVDPEDLGRVIGKRGATAQSLRTLLRALGTKNDARYNLKIIDNGEPGMSNAPSTNDSHTDDADSTAAPVQSRDEEDEDGFPTKAAVSSTSVVDKTRKELEELDDLDV
ncbi:MAG TPA: KH domain-containing protein [Patescibacteria group bacterium]|nr:KH domain-containing protein [Patescibacteria group bacterium]